MSPAYGKRSVASPTAHATSAQRQRSRAIGPHIDAVAIHHAALKLALVSVKVACVTYTRWRELGSSGSSRGRAKASCSAQARQAPRAAQRRAVAAPVFAREPQHTVAVQPAAVDETLIPARSGGGRASGAHTVAKKASATPIWHSRRAVLPLQRLPLHRWIFLHRYRVLAGRLRRWEGCADSPT